MRIGGWLVAGLVVSAACWWGCGSSGPSTCVPGMASACACTDGSKGSQVCAGDGASFASCSCEGSSATTGASSSTGSSSSTSGGIEVCEAGYTQCGAPDGGVDSGVTEYDVVCVNLAIDHINCGACGAACAENSCGAPGVCMGGTCVPEQTGCGCAFASCDDPDAGVADAGACCAASGNGPLACVSGTCQTQ